MFIHRPTPLAYVDRSLIIGTSDTSKSRHSMALHSEYSAMACGMLASDDRKVEPASAAVSDVVSSDWAANSATRLPLELPALDATPRSVLSLHFCLSRS